MLYLFANCRKKLELEKCSGAAVSMANMIKMLLFQVLGLKIQSIPIIHALGLRSFVLGVEISSKPTQEQF